MQSSQTTLVTFDLFRAIDKLSCAGKHNCSIGNQTTTKTPRFIATESENKLGAIKDRGELFEHKIFTNELIEKLDKMLQTEKKSFEKMIQSIN